MGGVTDVNFFDGYAHWEGNTYLGNIASSAAGIGAGSVHKILSSLISKPTIKHYNNFYANNIAQASGIKI